MEVEPNIAVLGITKVIEMVPPPCTNTRVFILVELVVDAMLPAMVIKGKYRYKPGIEGLLVGVPMYNKMSR